MRRSLHNLLKTLDLPYTLVSSTSRLPYHATEGKRGCPRGQWPNYPRCSQNGHTGRTTKSSERNVGRSLKEFKEGSRGMNYRVARLEQDPRQPRDAMEADGPADTKTRERTEGTAKAVQAMHRDSFSANRVNPDPMCSTSFGVKAEPSAFPCRDDVLVENGAAAPNSCFSPLEMRSPTAAGGLFSAGMASTATWATSDRPLIGDFDSVCLARQQLIDE